MLSTLLTVALISTSLVDAAPWPTVAKHSTHRVRNLGRGLQVETFHPATTFQTYGAGIDHPAAQTSSFLSSANGSLKDTSISFIQSQLNLTAAQMGWKSGYAADLNTKFAYIKQYHDGIPFANAVANVAFKQDKVVSFGSSFVEVGKIASSIPSIAVEDIIPGVEESLQGTHNGFTSLEYLSRPDGSVALAHTVQIRNETEGTWYEAFVCAHSGALMSVTDFVADATFTVLPISKQDPDQGLETLVDPEDLLASPEGWNSDGTTNTTTTEGNNGVAFKTSARNVTPASSSANLEFDYAYDDSKNPTLQSNIDASRTNAFYVMNTIHDIAYRYGFTEAAFNFQEDNFGKGGKDGDSVQVSVQDASGTNNANFATPPDGQSGVCRMFIWTLSKPNLDGAMENDIISHEMTHGITSRMTGGGTGRCLQTTEAGGMGEGWSDAMAEWTEQTSATITDFTVGSYVTGNPAGIRSFPYSTSAKVNPLRYSSLQTLDEVHDIGEVWANMLHNVYAALVTELGFSATAKTDPTGPEGNVVFMQLFIDSLALQPCNPTFVSSRDAWIQADANRYNGANRCTLFKAFASRGLGLKAKNFKDDSSIPADC
ncbi:Fungalysin metallopeptidase-domain-containing protein [Mycena floridula]|nr:Fungalysin metallopeptidase-domain-containing protein [Mycena floridula]